MGGRRKWVVPAVASGGVLALIGAGALAASTTGVLPGWFGEPEPPPTLTLEEVHDPERSDGLQVGDTVGEHPGLLLDGLVAVQVDDEEYLVVDPDEPVPSQVSERVAELTGAAAASGDEGDRFDLVVAALDVVTDTGGPGVVLVLAAAGGWETWWADHSGPDQGVRVHTGVVHPDKQTAYYEARDLADRQGLWFPQREDM